MTNPLRYLETAQLKRAAENDNIKVTLKIVGDRLVYCIGSHGYYDTFQGALARVKYLQSQIAYTPFDPEKDA